VLNLGRCWYRFQRLDRRFALEFWNSAYRERSSVPDAVIDSAVCIGDIDSLEYGSEWSRLLISTVSESSADIFPASTQRLPEEIVFNPDGKERH